MGGGWGCRGMAFNVEGVAQAGSRLAVCAARSIGQAPLCFFSLEAELDTLAGQKEISQPYYLAFRSRISSGFR
jgi:hypothetical protein